LLELGLVTFDFDVRISRKEETVVFVSFAGHGVDKEMGRDSGAIVCARGGAIVSMNGEYGEGDACTNDTRERR
jgi:hypothetical protein